MFQSATIKLTGWYLLILMTISILFSLAIFEITTFEVGSRLERFERNLQIASGSIEQPLSTLRSNEMNAAAGNIISVLFAANLLILCVGGAISYVFARRTLKPIKEAHEAQSRFTSDASHELRTPLAAMKTEIEVALRDKSATKKDFEDVMKSTLEEVDNLTHLSEMLLNLSRLDHNKLKTTVVHLHKVTNTIVRRYNIPTRRVAIKSTKRVFAIANEAAVSELISILVDNALKYSPEDSTVNINIYPTHNQVCFEITNTGQGIKADKLPYIFDRFYRADTSRTHRTGYGLGLSIAKKIVELSKGELTVTSTPNETTIFTFALPAHQPKLSRTKKITTK